MTSHSDQHQCEICGTYGFFGFKQKDGDYLWYCFHHQPVDYVMPEPASPKGQMTLSLEAPDQSAMERVRNTFDWGYGLRTWIHWEMKPGDEMIGETMVKHAARWIGGSSNDAVIGAACLMMAKQGYLVDTGRSEPMKNKSSHGRRSPVWRRSDKR